MGERVWGESPKRSADARAVAGGGREGGRAVGYRRWVEAAASGAKRSFGGGSPAAARMRQREHSPPATALRTGLRQRGQILEGGVLGVVASIIHEVLHQSAAKVSRKLRRPTGA